VVSIRIESNKIIIEVKGYHRIWALKKQIVLNIGRIKSVQIADKSLRPDGIRFPGTYIPKALIAGTYIWSKRREFWDTTLKGKAIEIILDGGRYSKVVVDVEHPSEAVEMIREAIRK
jgi:hypothetical protein